MSSSVTPTQCLGEAFLQRPRTGMDEASLKAELQGLGEAELEEHWTNYVVQDGEHTLVWHMVKAEGPQGQERWSLKTFRDDEDGPTLLAEQMFPSKTLAQQALKEKLPPGSLEQRTRTWHYPHGVSVKHQLDDGLVSSFEITQGRSRYSCETNGCRCARL